MGDKLLSHLSGVIKQLLKQLSLRLSEIYFDAVIQINYTSTIIPPQTFRCVALIRHIPVCLFGPPFDKATREEKPPIQLLTVRH